MTQAIRIVVLRLLSIPAMAQRPIDFAPLDWPQGGNLVVPVSEGISLTGLAAELDERLNGAIAMAATEEAFKGEKGQALCTH